MLKKFYTLFLLLFIPAAGFCGVAGGSILFYPKLSLSGAYADTAFQYYTYERPYKSAAAVVELPVHILMGNNFYADINYFVRADYNKNISMEDGVFYTYNFQNANLNYQNDLLAIKLGRQGYQSRNKDFVIYYGGYDGRRDNIAPTALDAARHSLKTKYFSYDLLLGREVKKLSFYDDDSLVYGATAGFNLADILGLDIFYYGRNTSFGASDYKISVYGAGAELNIEDSLSISLYAAKNCGEKIYHFMGMTSKTDIRGYAVNGALKIPGENSLGKTLYAVNIYYGSPQSGGDSMPFVPISQNMDRGYVFGGMDIIRYAAAPRQLSGNLPFGADITDLMIYSLTYNLDLDYPRYISLGGGIYNFAATSSHFTSRDLGSELDLNITYKKGPLALTAYYGLFISGSGLGAATGLPGTPAGGKIQKLGLHFSYEFMI